MTTAEITGIIAALAALLTAGGWLTKLGLQGAERRKLNAESEKTLAEAGNSSFSQWSQIFDALRKEVERLKGDRDEVLARMDEVEERSRKHALAEEECTTKLKAATARISRLEAALPIALAGERIGDMGDTDLGAIFDQIRDPMVISSTARDGMFLWVNECFAETLQMTREEVLAAGWRKLVVEEDLGATQSVEGRSWDEPVRGFDNRYRRRDGSSVRLRWWAATYRQGVTLAIARVVGSIEWPKADAEKPPA